MDPEARRRATPYSTDATDQADPLVEPDATRAPSCASRARARAGPDRSPRCRALSSVAATVTWRCRGGGVLDDVGQRLLDDRGTPSGTRRRLASVAVPDRTSSTSRPDRPYVVDQRRYVVESLGGRPGAVLGRPRAACPSIDRVCSSALRLVSAMTSRLLLGGVRVGADHVRAHPGLHRDQRHAVRHDVVQLAGDPQPFLGDGGDELLAAGTAAATGSRPRAPRRPPAARGTAGGPTSRGRERRGARGRRSTAPRRPGRSARRVAGRERPASRG